MERRDLDRGKGYWGSSVDQMEFSISALTRVAEQISNVLSPNLLLKEYRIIKEGRGALGTHPNFGHCYLFTEALYHLFGKKNGLRPHRVAFKDRNGNNVTHWFLKHKTTGQVVDPTYQQFDEWIPYNEGKAAMFPTGNRPSNRCKEVFRRIKAL